MCVCVRVSTNYKGLGAREQSSPIDQGLGLGLELYSKILITRLLSILSRHMLGMIDCDEGGL